MTLVVPDSIVKNNFPSKYSSFLLILCMAIAAALRAWYLTGVINAPDFREMRQDLSVQDYQARAILSGDWTLPEGRSDPEIPTTPYYRPPGYCYLLAAIYFFSDGSYLAPRLFNIFIGLISILLMFRIAKIIWNKKVGLICAFLMSTYWGFIYYEGEVNDPAVFVLLIPCLLLALYHWSESFAVRWAILAGIITGTYALMRPNILLFGPFMAAWMLWMGFLSNRLRSILPAWVSLALSTFLMILPVTTRNYIVSGEIVPISTYFGENLHIGNSEYSDGYTSWTPYLQELEGTGQFSVWEYANIVHGLGREIGNPNLTHSEASRIFARKAITWIKENKSAALKLTLKKAILFWSPQEITENKVVHYEKAHYPPLKYLPGFPYVLTLFLLGTVFVIRDSLSGKLKTYHIGNGMHPYLSLLPLIFCFIVLYWISFLPFFVNARARHPLVGLLLLIGAFGVYRFFEVLANHNLKKTCLLLVGVIAFALMSCYEPYNYKPDKARWHYARSDSWLRQGKLDLAEVEAEQVLKEHYSSYMPFRLGHAFAAKGRNEIAVRLLRAALTDTSVKHPAPYRQDLYFHIGASLAVLERYDEARASFEEALRLNPNDARAHNDLGVLLEKQGLLEEALQHYRLAVESNPKFDLPYSNLGNLLGSSGNHAEAIESFIKASELSPDNPDHLYNLGVHSNALGNLADAIHYYEQALQVSPRHIKSLNNIGLLYAGMGRIEDGISCFKKAIDSDPSFVLARINLGNLLIESGIYDQGIATYLEALQLFPENIFLHNGIGYQFMTHEEYARAGYHFKEALRIQPDNEATLANMAVLSLKSGQIKESLDYYEKLIQISPANMEYRLQKGNILARLGDFNAAYLQYKELLESDPTNSAAATNLEQIKPFISPKD